MISQDPEILAAQAEDYFNNLFPELGAGESIDLRYKRPEANQMSRKFCKKLDEAVDLALALGRSHDVYSGVAPRWDNVGTKEGVTRLFALWGDADVKGHHTSKSRMDQLQELSCPPSMLVWSGGGYHPYWFLLEPAQGLEELARAERIMARIAQGLDGDPVYDRSRILRVPGTFNHKQDDPRPVRLVHHDPEQRYTLDQLEEMCESFPEAARDVAQKKNKPETAKQIAGQIQEGSRNNALTSLAGSMRYRGMSEEAIFAALKVENESRCETPLPKNEVRAIARSIGRYEATSSSYNALDSTTFPVHVLPRTLRRFVEETAASIGCPPDFVAVPLLSTLGSAIGNSRVIVIKIGYMESASLYIVIVGDPGSSKSPALKDATAPATKKQEELGCAYREAVAEYNQEQRMWEEGSFDLESDPPTEPIFRRCIVQDTTIEALIERLGENPRGLLSSNDELSSWVRQQDQYKSGGKGTDRQFWLSAWSNQPVVVDRKGRKEPIMVYRPFVGLAGGIQPGVLSELKNNREDGLLDRFLFAYPDPMPVRWSDSEISEETRAAYKYVYDELYGLHMDIDENGSPAPIQATFTASAKQLFIEAYNSLCEEMEHPEFPSHLKGPWSKMRAYLARLSLIIGMAYIVEPDNRKLGEVFYGFMKNDPMITDRHVKAAIELIDYFKAHARRVYAKLPGSGKSSPNQANADKGVNDDKNDSVAQFLVRFLDNQGGSWDGMTSKLYKICRDSSVSGLPGGAGSFGKEIRKIANDPDNGISLNEGYLGKQPIIKLSLPTVGTLGAVGGTYTETTDSTESKKEAGSVNAGQCEASVHEDRLAEIKNAMDRLFKEYPEHKGEQDPEVIAVELFWWNLLPFIPTEEEVKQALNG